MGTDMSEAGLQRNEITVDGLRSPVLEAGPEDAVEAAVFVHGNPGSSLDWLDLLPQVGSFGRGLAIDMPGFGHADKPADFEYTVWGYARHLGRLIDELGIDRVHLILHDFGGPWGLLWATFHPEKFASATLINTGILPGYRWHTLARIWRTPIVGEAFQAIMGSRLAFGLIFSRGNPRGLPSSLVERMHSNYDKGTRRAVLKLYRATNNPGGATRLTSALRPLNRPGLVIWGRHDPYLPVAFADQQLNIFPGARIQILEESGHWPFADDPEAVATAVVPFLRSQILK